MIETRVCDIINNENASDLTYYGYCFNESLRMEPPVHFSSALTFSENVQLGKYSIRKGENFSVHMYLLHHRNDIW